MEWKGLKTQKDIDELMEVYGGFHDGCLKELNYVSGSYVHDDLSMSPFNSKRAISIIFQRQYNNPRTIEMIFEKVIKLNLVPTDEDYDSIIFDAFLGFRDGKIYWADWEGFDINSPNENFDCTWITALNAKWRIID